MIAPLKIDGWSPVAASVGVAHAHHVNPIPLGVRLDGNFVSVFVWRTFARTNVSVEEPADASGHVSKGWSQSVISPS